MSLIELKNKFVEDNPDYANDVANFFSYITDVEKLNLASDTYIVDAMNTQKVIKSLEYHVESERIKKEEPAKKYISAVRQLFEFLLSHSQYENSDFKEQLANPATREKSYTRMTTEFIENNKKLLPKESYSSLTPEDVDRIIEWCDSNINTAMHNTDLECNRIEFKRLVASLCIKLMIFSGITYRVARNLKLRDLEIAQNTIKINGYELRLPLNLSVQLQFYYKLRNTMDISHADSFLFVKPTGNGWNESTSESGIPSFLKPVVGQTALTGIIKYGIIQLIMSGLNDSIITEITGASKEILNDCLKATQNENNLEKTVQIINSKLVMTNKYYSL